MSGEKIKVFLQDIVDCNFTQPLVDNITSDVAKDILDYITNLQEENQRLKELADKYEEEHKTTFIEWTNTLDRNRKAIEYIKHLDNVFIDDKKQDEILNILEGSDKE